MHEQDDIVSDILNRVRNALGDVLTVEMERRLIAQENEIRNAWGGNDVYVQKINRSDRNKKRGCVINAIRNGKRIDEISSEFGLSRARIYQYLGRGKKK